MATKRLELKREAVKVLSRVRAGVLVASKSTTLKDVEPGIDQFEGERVTRYSDVTCPWDAGS